MKKRKEGTLENRLMKGIIDIVGKRNGAQHIHHCVRIYHVNPEQQLRDWPPLKTSLPTEHPTIERHSIALARKRRCSFPVPSLIIRWRCQEEPQWSTYKKKGCKRAVVGIESFFSTTTNGTNSRDSLALNLNIGALQQPHHGGQQWVKIWLYQHSVELEAKLDKGNQGVRLNPKQMTIESTITHTWGFVNLEGDSQEQEEWCDGSSFEKRWQSLQQADPPCVPLPTLLGDVCLEKRGELTLWSTNAGVSDSSCSTFGSSGDRIAKDPSPTIEMAMSAAWRYFQSSWARKPGK